MLIPSFLPCFFPTDPTFSTAQKAAGPLGGSGHWMSQESDSRDKTRPERGDI